ncbi:MAG: toxin-antitoxin system YwqK family antitoxin [Prevotella sp.]
MKTRLFLCVMALCIACGADAQTKTKRSKTARQKAKVVEVDPEVVKPVEVVDSAILAVADSLAADSIAAPEPEKPKDRTDTLYYDKNWRVIGNKTFATYYRYALYPVDSLAPRYFKTFFLSGELQGEGTFLQMGERSDKETVFDGEVVYYYKDGAEKQRLFYSDGKPNGECTDYYENGGIKEHITLVNGKRNGIHASFTEDGIVCRLQEYADDVAADYYVIVDKDGNYSKYDAGTEKPILETPDESERQTEYKNGVAWPYYNKNGLILGVSNSPVKENIGDFREIGVFLVNKSMINVELDPAQIEVYSMKKGKRSDFKMMPADEYDEKVYKKKVKNQKRSLKRKAVVTIERENNVSENLGASVFDAGTSHTLKAFQESIISLKTLVKGNKMRYAEREHEDLGYLERTTVHPGEMVAGFLYTDDKKVDDLFVKLTVNGVPYIYEWKVEKK